MKDNEIQPKLITITTRIREDLVGQVEQAMSKSRRKGSTSAQDVYNAALEAFFRDRLPHQPIKSTAPEAYQDDLERLRRILQNSSREDRDFLRSALSRCEKDLHERPKEPKAVTPNPIRSSRSAKDQHRPSR